MGMIGIDATSPLGPAAPRPGAALVRIWTGLLLPPIGWVADLLGRYFLIRFVNAHDLRWPLFVPTVLGLGLLALGARLCWRARRQPEGASPTDTLPTLAAWGLVMAAFFLLLILAQAYPDFVLTVREIA
jgi:hypothetical protein